MWSHTLKTLLLFTFVFPTGTLKVKMSSNSISLKIPHICSLPRFFFVHNSVLTLDSYFVASQGDFCNCCLQQRHSWLPASNWISRSTAGVGVGIAISSFCGCVPGYSAGCTCSVRSWLFSESHSCLIKQAEWIQDKGIGFPVFLLSVDEGL